MSLVKQKELDELRDYAELCGDELGEACGLLLQIYEYGDYFSEDFFTAVVAEIRSVLYCFKEDYVIEERELPPKPPMKTRELVRKDEVGDE